MAATRQTTPGSAARAAAIRSPVKVAIPQRRGRFEATNAIRMAGGPAPAAGTPDEGLLTDLYLLRARTLRARLHVERHALTTTERVEVVDAVPVEEVLRAVGAGDESDAAVGSEPLDGSVLHRADLLASRTVNTPTSRARSRK